MHGLIFYYMTRSDDSKIKIGKTVSLQFSKTFIQVFTKKLSTWADLFKTFCLSIKSTKWLIQMFVKVKVGIRVLIFEYDPSFYRKRQYFKVKLTFIPKLLSHIVRRIPKSNRFQKHLLKLKVQTWTSTKYFLKKTIYI